jgi:Acyl-CoA reductase (LuxC)
VIDQLSPAPARVEPAALAARLAGAPAPGPFDPLLIEFCDAFARRLLAERARPELVALAFAFRRAATTELAAQFAALDVPGTVLVPRGLAFHVPPANVDTMFAYSLLVSLLVGNRNVVRVSARAGEARDILCAALNAVLAEDRFAAVRSSLAVVTYGREDAVTAAFSAACDVRLVWGGDASVAAVRAVPLPSTATELAFGDRFSLAAVGTRAVLDADPAELAALADALYNDAYWFDQMACASPRLVAFVGEDPWAASDALFGALAGALARRGYRLDPSAAMAKLRFVFEAAVDRPLLRVARPSAELAVLRLATLEGFDRTHPGGGLFFEAALPDLTALVPFLRAKDQTLGVFGLGAGELAGFAAAAGSRAVDRIVPIGRALAFGRFWDGFDLLAELTRRVVVAPGG